MKEIIHTDQAPQALGPYSQAVSSQSFVFTSGQIAINPATGELVGGTIEDETEQVLKNVRAVLAASGCSMEDVVSVSVYVTDMHDYARINNVYAKYFNEDNAPARALVEVRNLPKFVRIEISAIAVRQPK
jgi:2-iminobutanoate/2-iminopropanoate deaminase